MRPADEEARDWILELRAFTASDLADVMAIRKREARLFIRHFRDRGVVEPTEEMLNGNGPPERVYCLAPYPPGPTHHPHKTPPEVVVFQQMGGDPLRVPRGLPVRLLNHQDRRNQMQVAGARRRMKDRDRAYDRMLQAVAQRKAKNQEKHATKLEEKVRRKQERARRRMAEAQHAASKAVEHRARAGGEG